MATISGLIFALHAVSRDGLETEIPIQPGLDLSDPLPVEADAVELLIELDGPVVLEHALKTDGRILRREDPGTLRVVLEDPEDAAERGAVTLELVGSLEDGVLEDALIAVGW